MRDILIYIQISEFVEWKQQKKRDKYFVFVGILRNIIILYLIFIHRGKIVDFSVMNRRVYGEFKYLVF